MKITSSEEYGIRILIRIASANPVEGLSIPQLSEAEKLTEPHVAKICRTLRMEGFINSTPGYKGGYVLADAADAKVTLIATGSEIEIAMNTQKALGEKGIAARVVSMPSTNLFDRQDAA